MLGKRKKEELDQRKGGKCQKESTVTQAAL